jgi:membrane protein YdbS with pleckstrin-like domain
MRPLHVLFPSMSPQKSARRLASGRMTDPDESGQPQPPAEDFIFALERPLPALMTCYLIRCLPALLFPPVGILLLLVHYFRYKSMRYRFDDAGISMQWGILYRRQTILNYAKIQDIHLVSGFVERWLNLARIQIQTASGSSMPEMTLEGLPNHEQVRDFLYSRMRGTKDITRASHVVEAAVPNNSGSAAASPGGTAADAELAAVLREVSQELRSIRELITQDTPR